MYFGEAPRDSSACSRGFSRSGRLPFGSAAGSRQRLTSWYQWMRLRGTLITGLTRDASMPEFFGLGAPITNATLRAELPVPMLTMPATGVGGRPPPARVLLVGAMQKS